MRDVAPAPGTSPHEFFAGHPLGLAVFERLQADLGPLGDVEVRVSTSQVTFSRRRGFAHVWLPGRYLAHPGADVVLSVALRRRIDSPRWKQVVEPRPGRWMHHLEVTDVAEVDAEVLSWVREAADCAG